MRMPAVSLALLSLVAVPTMLVAQQRLELGVHGGYYRPTTMLFHRVVPVPASTGFSFVRTEGKNDPGSALGLDLAFWLKPTVGISGATSLRFSDRSHSTPRGSSTTIGVHSFRLLARARVGPLQLRIGGGPALVHIGGSAEGLGKRSFAGGAALADLTASVGPLRCRLGIEDAMYRVTLPDIAPTTADTSSTPLQHDLVISLGVTLPLR